MVQAILFAVQVKFALLGVRTAWLVLRVFARTEIVFVTLVLVCVLSALKRDAMLNSD